MTLKIDLSPDDEAALNAAAQAQGISAEQWLQRLIEDRLRSERPARDTPAAPQRPLSARIRDLWADMPEDVRAEYPEGGACQIDHHVYGLPKR